MIKAVVHVYDVVLECIVWVKNGVSGCSELLQFPAEIDSVVVGLWRRNSSLVLLLESGHLFGEVIDDLVVIEAKSMKFVFVCASVLGVNPVCNVFEHLVSSVKSAVFIDSYHPTPQGEY